MKTVRLRQQLAFTLIELITVIAIISILMALLFPAIAGAKEAARRTKAQTILKDIVRACKEYTVDYGKFPPLPEAKEDATSGSGKDKTTSSYYSYGPKTALNGKEGDTVFKLDNQELFNILRAIEGGKNVEHKYNKRQQKYFEQPKASDPKNPREGFCDGKEFDTKVAGQLMDPWGTQYAIVLDADGDEELDLKTFYTDLSDKKDAVRFSAVAFSLGKDGKRGGKGYAEKTRKENSKEAPDDLFSWQ